MVYPVRTRKRVRALRRAPDGSAFQKCDSCGASVPIALADMHACGGKKEIKRFKGVCKKPNALKQDSGDHLVRSPFRFFMESFVKSCKSGKLIDMDRKGFRAWKNMTEEEKQPYVVQSQKVIAANDRALVEEANNMLVVDEEADSAMVGKFDKLYKDYEGYQHSDSSGFESLNTYEWEMIQSESSQWS